MGRYEFIRDSQVEFVEAKNVPSKIVEGVRKMLKDIELTEEYLEMNGSNEKMNAEILEFITNNPDFDWNSVTI